MKEKLLIKEKDILWLGFVCKGWRKNWDAGNKDYGFIVDLDDVYKHSKKRKRYAISINELFLKQLIKKCNECKVKMARFDPNGIAWIEKAREVKGNRLKAHKGRALWEQ